MPTCLASSLLASFSSLLRVVTAPLHHFLPYDFPPFAAIFSFMKCIVEVDVQRRSYLLLKLWLHSITQALDQRLCDVFGNTDRPLVKEDLMNLKYLERVVKESLRLYPPVPFVIRKVLEEVTLPSGRTLPAGCGVVVSIWGVHRDPKYWGPDAEQFDPDRFLPERFKLEHTCNYMPFSHGPRNCLGYQYALMSVKASLSAILRRYRVVEQIADSPVPHIKVKLDIMMKAVDGYELALERRAHAAPA